MIDLLSDYIENKIQGLIIVEKLGDAYAATVKKYNERTGTEVEPEIFGFDEKIILFKIDKKQKEIVDLQAVLADIKEL